MRHHKAGGLPRNTTVKQNLSLHIGLDWVFQQHYDPKHTPEVGTKSRLKENRVQKMQLEQ